MRKFLAILMVATLMLGTLGMASFAAEPTKANSWGNVGFEDHHDDAKTIWYVMWTQDAEDWARIMGTSEAGDVPDMENNKYTMIIDGIEYVCDTATVYNGGTWGYLRFWLGNTSFAPKFGATYTVQWKVEAKDGSWAYTCDPFAMTNFKGEKPAAEAITGDGLTAIQALTNLTDKVNQDSVDTNVGTYNDTTETEKSVFDGDLTNKMGSGDNKVTITWSTTEAVTVTDYVVISGNDVANNPGRNPLLWTLYGSNDGENWAVLDTVGYAGLEAAVSTAYGFEVDNPGAYTQYKLELVSDSGFELGELTLYNDPAYKAPETNEQPDTTEQPETNEQPTTNESPKTGDAVLAVSALALIAAAATVAVARRRKIEE